MKPTISYRAMKNNRRLTEFEDFRTLVVQATVRNTVIARKSQDFVMERPLQFFFKT